MKKTEHKYLNGIDAFRTIMIYGVVLFHANELFNVSIAFSFLSLGVYGCFVLTGFLYGYYHWDSLKQYHFRDSCTLVIKKIDKFYPLHFVTFILAGLLGWRYWSISKFLSKYQISRIVANLMLIQSFVPKEDFYFSYNGVSWYLSATLFLYFMAPFIVGLLRRLEKNNHLSIAYASCVFCELIIVFLVGQKTWMFYINPVNNLYALIIGIIWGRICCCMHTDPGSKKKEKTEIIAATIILAISASIASCFEQNLFLNTCVLSSLFGMLLNAIASERTVVSERLSSRFWSFMSSFSFEVFMFHQVIGRYMLEIQKKCRFPILHIL